MFILWYFIFKTVSDCTSGNLKEIHMLFKLFAIFLPSFGVAGALYKGFELLALPGPAGLYFSFAGGAALFLILFLMLEINDKISRK